jgi:hypothetical protein
MIEVIRWTPVDRGSLVGYADLYVEKMGLEIYGCSLLEKNGSKWLNMPSKEYTNAQGEKKYSSVVRFRSKEHAEAFEKAARLAIGEKIAELEAELLKNSHGASEYAPELEEGLPF